MQLTKHPLENRLYSWEFGPNPLPPTARGTQWPTPATEIAGLSQSFSALLLPLLLGGMMGNAASVTVTRDDGGTADLTVQNPVAIGTQIRAQVSGGTPGRLYTLTAVATCTGGDVVAGQGTLAVSSVLPG